MVDSRFEDRTCEKWDSVHFCSPAREWLDDLQQIGRGRSTPGMLEKAQAEVLGEKKGPMAWALSGEQPLGNGEQN